MKAILVTGILFFTAIFCRAQEIPAASEQQFENLADAEQAETEDDSFLQLLDHFRKKPLNINTADEAELRELRILTDLQIAQLIAYRKLFGHFISLYELQAIPSWDIASIRKLLPFITIGAAFATVDELRKWFKGGDHVLLFRVSQVLERSKGFDPDTSGTRYLGSPQRLFFRYRYSYKNLLQYGLTADKDAGEQLFKGAQQSGFDFYSFHLFARKMGIIQNFAIGDFTVNMGQGLIQWQSLAFKKSSEVMGVKRQSAVLRPYNSAGEFYFHRGIGVTIKKRKWESTLFASLRKLSANFVSDSITKEDFISSFQNSGYHRTTYENADRNKLTQTAFGGNLIYHSKRWHTGINAVYYQFSLPVHKRNEPYNLYAISGSNWSNLSIDYSYTYKNVHFFGEAAVDKNFSKAVVNGLLISADSRVDISFVHRMLDASYQAVYGNAFTENTYPTNESGFYIGMVVRPLPVLRLDVYADLFKFPWLKYRVDAPSRGADFLAQLTYTPAKQIELYTRFRYESREGNQSDDASATNFLVKRPKQNFRIQAAYKLNRELGLRCRGEVVWYDKKGINKANGFLLYTDILYKPMLRPLSAAVRLQYFETDDYNSRIYAYENDVLYSYTIPALFGKGLRYYCTFTYDLSKKITIWGRWAQTLYRGQDTIGSGLDEIADNKKTEVKLQIRCIL
jgi:hypothetical protein